MQAATNALNESMGPAPGNIIQTEYKPRSDGSTMKALTWQGRDNVKLIDVPGMCCGDSGHFLHEKKINSF